MIKVPKEILWDYEKAPEDLLWRLQRIADFFPLYGRDPETIELLYIIRGRFLEGPPSMGTLRMKQSLNPDVVSQFFKEKALAWISKSLEAQD